MEKLDSQTLAGMRKHIDTKFSQFERLLERFERRQKETDSLIARIYLFCDSMDKRIKERRGKIPGQSSKDAGSRV